MGTYKYPDNGFRFQIHFIGGNENYGQFLVETGEADTLKGYNVTYFNRTVVNKHDNVFYEPIPFEMVKTYETKPQVIVNIDGEPAVCHSMACDFTYVDPVGEISTMAFDGSVGDFGKVTVSGTDLPAIEDIVEMLFADTPCTIDEATMSATSIECSLTR